MLYQFDSKVPYNKNQKRPYIGVIVEKNYMYRNDDFIAYIQEVKNLGIFIELEIKKVENAEPNIEQLIDFAKSLNLKIGTKFDVRKAELLYSKQNNIKE